MNRPCGTLAGKPYYNAAHRAFAAHLSGRPSIRRAVAARRRVSHTYRLRLKACFLNERSGWAFLHHLVGKQFPILRRTRTMMSSNIYTELGYMQSELGRS